MRRRVSMTCCLTRRSFTTQTPGLTFSYIHKPKKNYRGKYPRLTLGEFLVMVLLEARKEARHRRLPSLDHAGGSLHPRRPLHVRGLPHLSEAQARGGARHLCDDQPASSAAARPSRRCASSDALCRRHDVARSAEKLARHIGDQLGLPKLEIMPGYSIEEMERYREEQPEAFDAYALTGRRDCRAVRDLHFRSF